MKCEYYILKGIFGAISMPVVLAGFAIIPLLLGVFTIPGIEPVIGSSEESANISTDVNEETTRENDDEQIDRILTSELIETAHAAEIDESSNKKAIRLRVLSVNIDGDITYGQDGDNALVEGFWSYPACSLPGEIGNSCIFGHRILHEPPEKETFYNLDQVQKGDLIDIQYDDGTWDHYEVVGISVHEETDFSIISQTDSESYVKLITCENWDVWDERLVITAKKVS